MMRHTWKAPCRGSGEGAGTNTNRTFSTMVQPGDATDKADAAYRFLHRSGEIERLARPHSSGGWHD